MQHENRINFYAIIGKKLRDIEILKEKHNKLETTILQEFQNTITLSRQQNIEIERMLMNKPTLTAFIRTLENNNLEKVKF